MIKINYPKTWAAVREQSTLHRFSSKFPESDPIRQALEEGWRAQRLKRCDNIDNDSNVIGVNMISFLPKMLGIL